MSSNMKTIAVVGLGYVGLPLAVEFGKKFRTIGLDLSAEKIACYKQYFDPTGEVSTEDLKAAKLLEVGTDAAALKEADFVIVAVPTPVDDAHQPDFSPLVSSSRAVGQNLKQGAIIVFESTVYPGATEEICIPIIEQHSGKTWKKDFFVGYSPERINPGDKERTVTKIVKVVSGDTPETLAVVQEIYNSVITAGVYPASCIKVAEAAKVIENTQRDLNIALMNELAIIFDRMDIDTREVIEAAGTKWNFHKYYPGLVGGHCISVDPFYLMHKSRSLGYEPQVIAAGRRVNDYMPHFIAKKVVQALIENGRNPGECRVLVMGITFKEDVADIRNSKVVDLIRELEDYSITIDVIDPHASVADVRHEYGIDLRPEAVGKYDAIIVAVGHREYVALNYEDIKELSRDEVIVFDIKGVMKASPQVRYKRL